MKITGPRSFMTREGDRPRVILAVDTDAGITGWGECYGHGSDRASPPLADNLNVQFDCENSTGIGRLVLAIMQQSRFLTGALENLPPPSARNAALARVGRAYSQAKPVFTTVIDPIAVHGESAVLRRSAADFLRRHAYDPEPARTPS